MKTPRKPKKKFTAATTIIRKEPFDRTMSLLLKNFSKTALKKASFFTASVCLALSSIPLLSACGDLGPDPQADGARFSRRFNYYYVQDCRFDAIGTYDCGKIHSISPSMFVSLRVDSDGLANLNLDGERYYYLESEYDEGYDAEYGGYYSFFRDNDELTIYKDGSEMALWSNDEGVVTFYFYELFY